MQLCVGCSVQGKIHGHHRCLMRNVMHIVGLLMFVLAAITGLALAVAGEQQGEESDPPPFRTLNPCTAATVHPECTVSVAVWLQKRMFACSMYPFSVYAALCTALHASLAGAVPHQQQQCMCPPAPCSTGFHLAHCVLPWCSADLRCPWLHAQQP